MKIQLPILLGALLTHANAADPCAGNVGEKCHIIAHDVQVWQHPPHKHLGNIYPAPSAGAEVLKISEFYCGRDKPSVYVRSGELEGFVDAAVLGSSRLAPDEIAQLQKKPQRPADEWVTSKPRIAVTTEIVTLRTTAEDISGVAQCTINGEPEPSSSAALGRLANF